MAEATTEMDFASIVNRHEAPLLRYVSHLLGRADDAAQDVVQEAFLRLHRHQRKPDGAEILDVSVWLFRVAHNLAMDAGRKRGRQQRAQAHLMQEAVERDESMTIDALGRMAREEACERAMTQVGDLPDDLRHVVVLRVIQGMTMRQIGDVLGIAPSNVCYRLNTALRKLAGSLRREGVI